MAHITGGGLIGNVPRVLPDGCDALVRKNSWAVPPVFRLIRERGGVDEDEMYRVFNMGIGLVMIVSEYFSSSIVAQLASQGFPAWKIGRITRGSRRLRFES